MTEALPTHVEAASPQRHVDGTSEHFDRVGGWAEVVGNPGSPDPPPPPARGLLHLPGRSRRPRAAHRRLARLAAAGRSARQRETTTLPQPTGPRTAHVTRQHQLIPGGDDFVDVDERPNVFVCALREHQLVHQQPIVSIIQVVCSLRAAPPHAKRQFDTTALYSRWRRVEIGGDRHRARCRAHLGVTGGRERGHDPTAYDPPSITVPIALGCPPKATARVAGGREGLRSGLPSTYTMGGCDVRVQFDADDAGGRSGAIVRCSMRRSWRRWPTWLATAGGRWSPIGPISASSSSGAPTLSSHR